MSWERDQGPDGEHVLEHPKTLRQSIFPRNSEGQSFPPWGPALGGAPAGEGSQAGGGGDGTSEAAAEVMSGQSAGNQISVFCIRELKT